jgi:hypothetical protein
MKERRRERKRLERERFAADFSSAVAAAGFFGPEVAARYSGDNVVQLHREEGMRDAA